MRSGALALRRRRRDGIASGLRPDAWPARPGRWRSDTANWYGHSRSNYFKVKDVEAFKAWAMDLDLQVDTNGEGLFVAFGDSEGWWPSGRWDEDAQEHIDVDFAAELQRHLADGEVVILMTTGAEKLRYLTGHAVALHADGRRLDVDLDDIYDKVLSAFGVKPTSATY